MQIRTHNPVQYLYTRGKGHINTSPTGDLYMLQTEQAPQILLVLIVKEGLYFGSCTTLSNPSESFPLKVNRNVSTKKKG
jgi:hypothetical protein